MRTELELYKLVLEVFKQQHSIFICKTITINRANLTLDEKYRLRQHFLYQYPTKTLYPDFYNHPLFNKTDYVGSSEWFKYDKTLNFRELFKTEAFELRIKFLEAIIERLGQENLEVTE